MQAPQRLFWRGPGPCASQDWPLAPLRGDPPDPIAGLIFHQAYPLDLPICHAEDHGPAGEELPAIRLAPPEGLWQCRAASTRPYHPLHPGARTFSSEAFGPVCCRSSVVEHSLGKGEVGSSILLGSTIPYASPVLNALQIDPRSPGPGARAPDVRPARHEKGPPVGGPSQKQAQTTAAYFIGSADARWPKMSSRLKR